MSQTYKLLKYLSSCPLWKFSHFTRVEVSLVMIPTNHSQSWWCSD